MARIEGEQNSDAGRVREWLARAANAARDPAWTADGVVSDHWSAVSPVTGALDVFQWRAPVEVGGDQSAASLAAKVEALIALGSAAEARTATARTQSQTQAPAATVVPPDPVPAAAPTRTLPPAPIVTPTQAAPPAPVPKVAPPSAERHSEPTEMLEPVDAPFRERTTPVPPKPQPASKPAPPPAQPRARKAVEPKIFVPPHAPDDPGTEAADDDFSAFPTSGAKA